MKLFAKVAILSLCVFTLCGCTQSSLSTNEVIVVGPSENHETEPEGTFERLPLIEEDEEPETMFDWEQVNDDVKEMFNDKDYYPLGIEMSYESDEDAKKIKLMWVLKDGATADEAMEYATELVRMFNNIIATQSLEVEPAEVDSFGSLWDIFALTVQISTENGSMMIDKTYAAGEKIDLKLPISSEGGPVASTEVVVSPGKH